MLNNGFAPVLVVAGALLDAAGRVLVQQRPANKQHGGLWEFPGGKVEPGEAPRAALCRELAEELGIGLDPDAAVPLAFAESGAVVLLLYVCRDWTGTPRALDAAALRWERPEALEALPMPPLDYPLAAALKRHVEARPGIEPGCKDLQSSA